MVMRRMDASGTGPQEIIMSLKTKLVSSLLSLAVVAGAMAGTVGQSEAKKFSKGEIAAIAGVGGLVLGLGIANAGRGPYYDGYYGNSWGPCRPLLRPLPDLRPSQRYLYRFRRFPASLQALRGGDPSLQRFQGRDARRPSFALRGRFRAPCRRSPSSLPRPLDAPTGRYWPRDPA